MSLSDGFGSVIVLHASQTGNAEAIAGRIQGDIIERGATSCSLVSTADYEKLDVKLERLVVCVISTTGQGDPPDSAGKFFRWVKGRSHAKDLLKSWQFAVLALGDTNYDQFCKPGKVLDKQLEELGGRRFVKGASGKKGEHGGPQGAADDAEGGLEATVEPWIDHLLETIVATGVGVGGGDGGAEVEMAEAAAVVTASEEGGDGGGLLADGEGRVVVLHGSQTGNAEAIAGRIMEDLAKCGKVKLSTLNPATLNPQPIDPLP